MSRYAEPYGKSNGIRFRNSFASTPDKRDEAPAKKGKKDKLHGHPGRGPKASLQVEDKEGQDRAKVIHHRQGHSDVGQG